MHLSLELKQYDFCVPVTKCRDQTSYSRPDGVTEFTFAIWAPIARAAVFDCQQTELGEHEQLLLVQLCPHLARTYHSRSLPCMDVLLSLFHDAYHLVLSFFNRIPRGT